MLLYTTLIITILALISGTVRGSSEDICEVDANGEMQCIKAVPKGANAEGNYILYR